MSFTAQSRAGSSGRSVHRPRAMFAGVALCVVLAASGGGPARATPGAPLPLAPTRTAEDQITVGSIPLAIAPGWKVGKLGSSYAVLNTNGGRTAYSLNDVSVDPGITKEEILAVMFQKLTNDVVNVQRGVPFDPELSGKRFQESEALKYNFLLQTDRGTASVAAALIVLFNPRAGQAGVINYVSDEDVYDNHLGEVEYMIKSSLD